MLVGGMKTLILILALVLVFGCTKANLAKYDEWPLTIEDTNSQVENKLLCYEELKEFANKYMLRFSGEIIVTCDKGKCICE